MTKSADFQVLLNQYRQAVIDTRASLHEESHDHYRTKLMRECEIAQELQEMYEENCKE